LRKDASRDEIATEVRDMHLSAINSLLTRWVFRFVLLKRAYTRATLEAMVAASRFGTWEILVDGIGLELRLAKQSPALTKTPRNQTAAEPCTLLSQCSAEPTDHAARS
jgi:hypothetical protein